MTSTKGVADVVFCLDASDSMKPCIDGVRTHIGSFLDGLKSDQQRARDVRFDFVAHHVNMMTDERPGHMHLSIFHQQQDMDDIMTHLNI